MFVFDLPSAVSKFDAYARSLWPRCNNPYVRFIRAMSEKDARRARRDLGIAEKQAWGSKDAALNEELAAAYQSLAGKYWRDKHGSLRRIFPKPGQHYALAA